jgi:hypothetical protein
MLDKEEVQEAIDKFRKYVVQQSRSNLTKQKKNASKKLYNSIKGVSKVNPNSISLYFEMEAHGVFQDKGVSGKEKKYNTPYSYKSKMPPTKALDKWVVRRGIAPRDAKGRLISRQSLKFAIAKGIFKNGIKPSLFFTKPFEVAYDRLPDELVEAYGIDIIKLYITND